MYTYRTFRTTKKCGTKCTIACNQNADFSIYTSKAEGIAFEGKGLLGGRK